LHLKKRIKAVLMTALAAMAVSTVGASAASAELVPASFSNSSFKMAVSNLTVRANGIEPKTCTSTTLTGTGEASGEFYAGNAGGFAESKFTCGGSSFYMVFLGEALYDTETGKYSLHVHDFGSWSLWSPWGSYSQVTGGGSDATWVNGSGLTASTATFKSQTTVGYTSFPSGKKVSIEGTFKVTTSTGGLLTLSH
jgi:hypothetical protein